MRIILCCSLLRVLQFASNDVGCILVELRHIFMQGTCCFLAVALNKQTSSLLKSGSRWLLKENWSCLLPSLVTRTRRCMYNTGWRRRGGWCGSGYNRGRHTSSLLGKFGVHHYMIELWVHSHACTNLVSFPDCIYAR